MVAHGGHAAARDELTDAAHEQRQPGCSTTSPFAQRSPYDASPAVPTTAPLSQLGCCMLRLQ